MRNFTLSRRTMLRGAAGASAITVGLPLLEAMLDANGTALAHGGDLPLRFLMYWWADGVNVARFEPQSTGADWALSEQMMPLAPVKDYLNVVTGLANHCDDQITHHEGMTVFNGYSFTQSGGGNGLNSDSGG